MTTLAWTLALIGWLAWYFIGRWNGWYAGHEQGWEDAMEARERLMEGDR